MFLFRKQSLGLHGCFPRARGDVPVDARNAELLD